MKVVVAPNAFKGSLTAAQAAAAIARGIRIVAPDAEIVEIPIADGGDGTVDALVTAKRGTRLSVDVEGPLGDAVTAEFGLIDGGRIAVVELASTSGLALIPDGRRDPRRASTFGFGQALEAALDAGAAVVIAGIGGSATNDGGAGMAQALGWRLLDSAGRDLSRGGAALIRLHRIDPSGPDPRWQWASLNVACDVTNPLTGPAGASAIYGPQKGADPETVDELDRALAQFAAIIERDLGKKVANIPGAGAAGGTGAGLIAFLNAELVPGAELVVNASGFDSALEGADLVITGEGRIDAQTAYGKAPGEVARRAKAAGVRTLVIAGTKGPGWDSLGSIGIDTVVTLDQDSDSGGHNLQDLMKDAGPALTLAAARAVKELV